MKNNKRYIVLLIILFVFFLVLFLTFGLNNLKSEKRKATVVFGNSSVFELNKKVWRKSADYNLSKFNWQKYNIILNNTYFGEYYLWHDDKWYAFDNNKNAVNISEDFFAYNTNYKVKVYDFKKDAVSISSLTSVLEENGLVGYNELTVANKIIIDFNNDGNSEEFYLLSNAFPIDSDPDKIFTLVFMNMNDRVYYMYKEIQDNQGFNGCKPYFDAIIDIDEDNSYEFAFSCGGYSVNNRVNAIYKFDKEEFKLLISN